MCRVVIFYRAANYERMAGWAWALASLGLTLLLSMRSTGVATLLFAQAGLFVAMWTYNVYRLKRKPK